MYKKRILKVGIFLALTSMGVAGASAHDAYELDTVVVTANRYAKSQMDISASTQTMTAKDINATGQNNLQQALSFLDSVTYAGMGPNGTPISSMTSKIIFRGVTDGTLVLVNGTPINWRGKYNLEDIPASSVEKVEVIRGGGAVLYGSQATGGVINIITKKKFDNSVSLGIGNYGQKDARVSVGVDKLSLAYDYSKMGDTGFISSTWADRGRKYKTPEMQQHFIKAVKHDILATYQISDDVNLLYNHNKSSNNWEYTFKRGSKPAFKDRVRYDREYTRNKDFFQLNLKDVMGISGNIYYNKNILKTKGTDYFNNKGEKEEKKGTKITKQYPLTTDKKEKNLSYGYDFQKVWQNDLATILFGTSYEKNKFYDYGKADYQRNIFSLFTSWDQKMDSDSFTLAGRYTWTTGGVKNFNNLSMQVQYLHDINREENIYLSLGQSFVLPTFTQMYSARDAGSTGVNLIGNADLSPEKGLHYEAGWKKNVDKYQYKVAAFYTKIKDNISYSAGRGKDAGKWFASNEDFKNYGIETSVKVQGRNGFSYNLGFTWQDPKSKLNSQKKGAKTYWDRSNGRIILNAGVNYQKDAWKVDLNMNYLADRVLSPSAEHSFAEKPYLLTVLHVGYDLNAEDHLNLVVNNILDRDDNICHGSTHYSTLPHQLMLSYAHEF